MKDNYDDFYSNEIMIYEKCNGYLQGCYPVELPKYPIYNYAFIDKNFKIRERIKK